MVYFLIGVSAFIVFLIYLCISLTVILKSRGKVEECEYILRKAYIRRYNFILGLSLSLSPDSSHRLLKLRESALKEKSIDKIQKINEEITSSLDSLELSNDDKNEVISLKEDIVNGILNYNNAVDSFNRRVFSLGNRMASGICHLKRLEKLGL